MKRLAGQVGRTLGWVLHHTGMIFITVFFMLAVALGLFAFRLSEGPIQIPWLASRLASIVSGQGVAIEIDRAALAWGGYRQGAVPLYLQLGGITVRNAAKASLATIRTGRLVFFPSALLGGRAPILVSSTDTLFQGSNVPVSMQAAIELAGFVSFSRAAIAVQLGAGELGAAGDSVPITGGRFDVSVTPVAVAVANGVLDLAPRGRSRPVLRFHGSGRRDGDWRGQLTLAADALAADDLAAYWPAQLLVQTRTWVTQNISAGSASGAAFTFGLSAPRTLTGLSLESATGSFKASDVSVGWIPGAPLITGVSGMFTLTDTDDIDIKADSGALGGLSLAGGTMHITGLLRHTQVGTFSIPVTGSVHDLLGVLNGKPLYLLKPAPPDVLAATGSVSGTVAATMPLRGDVTPDQVDLHASAALTDVAVPLDGTGLSLTGGNLALRTTIQAMSLQGGAQLLGEDAAISVKADFGAAPDIDLRLTGIAGQHLLRRYGLDADPGEMDGVTGDVPFDLHVTQSGTGRSGATLDADLTPAGMGVAALGWSKKPGVAGHVRVTAGLSGETLTGITGIDAAAPGLDVRASVDPANDGRLNFSALRIGASAATGSITAPVGKGRPWLVALAGPALDITAILNPPPKPEKPAAKPKPRPPSGPLWDADLKFGTFILAGHGAPVLDHLAFDGNGQGGTIFSARGTAGGTGGQAFMVTVAHGAGALHPEAIRLVANDGGYLLRALGAYGNLDGGALVLMATARDDGTDGIVRLDKFRLLQAPGFAKVLQSLTIYGVAAAASGPGLAFDRLVAPFDIANDRLTLSGARAFSSSLGFTASGTIDLASGDTALTATIIPAYALNALPGEIPVVGKLFSAEKGGGLFAVRARITGTLTDPDVTVNPFSAFTPGVLRDLFGAGAAAK
jgi:hypothetical protein